MSKIDLSEELKEEPKSKSRKKVDRKLKKPLILLGLISLVFAVVIIFIVSQLVDLPFQAGSRNLNVVVQDSVVISELKIEQARKSFLLILPNSFWDHTNFTDIDYSNKNIGLAVNNVLGYDMKKQSWSYGIADDGVSEIVSVVGKLTLDNVKYEANISFNLVDNNTYFYDLHLKEERRRSKYLPATQKQKSLLIQMMYRG